MPLNKNKSDENSTLISSEDQESLYGAAGCRSEEEDMPVTVDVAIERVGVGWGTLQLILGPFFVLTFEGVEILAISILGLILKCEWGLTSTQVILIQIASYIGWAIGSALSAAPSEIYGRKPPMMWGMMGLLVFGVMGCFAVGVWSFFVLRIMLGIFVGIAVGPAQVYLCELSSTEYRARIMSLCQISYGVGLLVSMSFAYLILGVLELPWNWYLLVTALIFAPVILLLYYTTAESPLFLVNNQGNVAQAQVILEKLRVKNKADVAPITLEKGSQDTNDEMSYRDIYRYILHHDYLLPIITFVVLMFCTLVCGTGFIYAAPRLINEPICRELDPLTNTTEQFLNEKCRGFSTQKLKEMTITVLLQPFTPFLAAVLSDRIGRRVTMVSLTAITFVFATFLMLCINRTFLLVNMFILQGLGPMVTYISYLFVAEYFPTVIRSFVTGLVYAVGRIAVIVAIAMAQWVYDENPRYMLGIMQVSAVGIIVAVLFLKKETAHLPLD